MAKKKSQNKKPYWETLSLKQDPFPSQPPDEAPILLPGWEQHLDLLQHLSRYSNVLLTVTGEAGLGKTTLIKHLINNIDEGIKPHQVTGQEPFDKNQLSKLLAEGFDCPVPDAKNEDGSEKSIDEILEEQLGGLQFLQDICLLVIDDAHVLSEDFLLAALNLVKLQSESQMKLHILLIGEKELANKCTKLASDTGQELCHSIVLDPMDEKATKRFVAQKLKTAGLEDGKKLLTPEAFTAIFKASQGLPAKLSQAAAKTLSDLANESSKPALLRILSNRRTTMIGGSVLIGLMAMTTGLLLHRHLIATPTMTALEAKEQKMKQAIKKLAKKKSSKTQVDAKKSQAKKAKDTKVADQQAEKQLTDKTQSADKAAKPASLQSTVQSTDVATQDKSIKTAQSTGQQLSTATVAPGKAIASVAAGTAATDATPGTKPGTVQELQGTQTAQQTPPSKTLEPSKALETAPLQARNTQPKHQTTVITADSKGNFETISGPDAKKGNIKPFNVAGRGQPTADKQMEKAAHQSITVLATPQADRTEKTVQELPRWLTDLRVKNHENVLLSPKHQMKVHMQRLGYEETQKTPKPKASSTAKNRANSKKPSVQSTQAQFAEQVKNPAKARSKNQAKTKVTHYGHSDHGTHIRRSSSVSASVNMGNQPGRYHVIQLMGSRSLASIKRESIAYRRLGTPTRIMTVRHKGRPWYILVYGRYLNRRQALKALHQLHTPVGHPRPWIRYFK